MPMRQELSTFFITLALVPLAGSFITEPAAMTLAALLLRDGYFYRQGQAGFKYLTLGVLFVNISIGGVLTAYAAPPVLMVASTFGWDTAYMASHFGWRAIADVLSNADLLTFVCRQFLVEGSIGRENANDPDTATAEKAKDADASPAKRRTPIPLFVMVIHVM